MKLSTFKPSAQLKVCALSMLCVFPSFFANCWHVADQQQFVNHQRDSDRFVIGRMVKSRQDGIFSTGGLTGTGSLNTATLTPEGLVSFQLAAYFDGLSFGSYSAYQSLPGGQGVLFSVLDLILPVSPRLKLHLFLAFTSLLSAVAVTFITLWFYQEFGLTVGLFVLASAVSSQWLTLFGRSLYWSTWAFYLPMVAVMYYLKKNTFKDRSLAGFGAIVFISILIKCLINGYEYITTTLVMAVVPFVYYSAKGSFACRKFFSGLLVALTGSCLAVLLSLFLLCFQIASVEGGFSKGVDHVVFSLQKRTHAGPQAFTDYATSLESKTFTVVMDYMKASFVDLNNYLPTSNSFISRYVYNIRYLYLIFAFLLTSAFICLRHRSTNSLALVFATWFSILAPLSWFVIFKAHSSAHRFLNPVIWQMPFTMFGFAVCGSSFKAAFPALLRSTCRFFDFLRGRHPADGTLEAPDGEAREDAALRGGPAREDRPHGGLSCAGGHRVY